MAKVDLSQFDEIKKAQDEGLPVGILDPTGTEIGVTITVAGPDSDRRKAANEKLIDARIERRQSTPMRASDLGLEGVRFLAAVTIGWTEFILDGVPYPYSEDNAVKLYQRFPWMKEQVDAISSDRARFTKASRQASSKLSETKTPASSPVSPQPGSTSGAGSPA